MTSIILPLLRSIDGDPLRRYAQGLPGWGGMSRPQRELHRSQARLRFALWANSMGKTYAGAAEAWWHLLQSHPFRETPDITGEGWMLADDLQQGWKTVCGTMRMLEPPGVVADDCHYDEIRGYTWRGSKVLRLRSGRRMVGKGGSQSPKATEGDKIDWLWVDEPPKRSHWNGCISRVNRTMGPIWATLTAVAVSRSEPIDWLRLKVDTNPTNGEPPQEGRYPAQPDGWDFLQRGLTLENAPHLGERKIQTLIEKCDPWERAQRVNALWEGAIPGRWVPAFSADNVFEELSLSADEIRSIGLGVDYGERPGNTIWYLAVCTTAGRVDILAEWSPSDRMSEAEEAIGVRDNLLLPCGLELHDIQVARGDSNSAGRRGVALSLNELMMQQFARMTRSGRPPFEIRPPYKGKGSVRARARMLNTACAEGRFRVHSSCVRLQQSLRNWSGANDHYKHAFDAAGYIAEEWLSIGSSPHARRYILQR